MLQASNTCAPHERVFSQREKRVRYRGIAKNQFAGFIQIIRVLAEKRRGMDRSQLIKASKLSNRGHISLVLRELEESDFIASFPELGKKKRGTHYYLNDEYTLFYLKWIEPNKGTLLKGVGKDFWIKRQSNSFWKSWAGFAFEGICLKHVLEIKKTLQMGGVSRISGYWQSIIEREKEVEVDLVIDRADQCINLCEIKFYNTNYVITKGAFEDLNRKKARLYEKTKAKKTLFVTLITPFGANENPHYQNIVNNQITLEDLFS